MERHLAALGVTDGEERVYMALLKLGSSSTGPIAKEAGVSRSKLYEILEKLSKKGFVSHFERNNVKQFIASPPTRIIDFIREKETELSQQEKAMEKIVPIFEHITSMQKAEQEARVYEGTEGIKIVRETCLAAMKPGETMYYFGNPASGHTYMLGYWDDFNKRRVEKKIWSWTIYNQDAKEYGERRKKLALTKVRYLPRTGSTHAWVEIYGDTVAIAMKHETPMSIVIRNKYVAESFKTYFDILWQASLDKI